MALTFRRALAEIEQALVRALRLGLCERLTFADTIEARAFNGLGPSGTHRIPTDRLAYVTGAGYAYEWSPTSTATDGGGSGSAVIKPSDIAPSAPGRWLRTSSTVSSGYIKAVNYWQGETARQEFQSRIYAAQPSVAVVWEGSDHRSRSTIPGAIYDYPVTFSVWCVDNNLRPNYQAMFGPTHTGDSAHPGVISILGDVKSVLADENKKTYIAGSTTSGILGLGGGVKVVQLGAEAMEDADLAERVMVLSLSVTVVASVENPDEASEHFTATSVYMQPNLTELHDQTELDADNCVIEGLAFTPGASLTAAPSNGAAMIAGVEVWSPSGPPAHTFTAERDTYYDFKTDGTFVYKPTMRDGAAPSVTANAIRVGVVTTDSLGIVSARYIAAVSGPFGDPYKAAPSTT